MKTSPVVWVYALCRTGDTKAVTVLPFLGNGGFHCPSIEPITNASYQQARDFFL